MRFYCPRGANLRQHLDGIYWHGDSRDGRGLLCVNSQVKPEKTKYIIPSEWKREHFYKYVGFGTTTPYIQESGQ